MKRCSEPLNRTEDKPMKEDPKRFTISVSAELFERLRTLQKERCPGSSQNEMLVSLIRKGLEASENSISPIRTKKEKE